MQNSWSSGKYSQNLIENHKGKRSFETRRFDERIILKLILKTEWECVDYVPAGIIRSWTVTFTGNTALKGNIRNACRIYLEEERPLSALGRS
jgi:hypothetical protein